MKAHVIRTLEQTPDSTTDLYHVQVDDSELAVFAKFPSLLRHFVQLDRPGAKKHHSTHVAVISTPTRRILVPVAAGYGQFPITFTPNPAIVLNEAKKEEPLAGLFAGVGIELHLGLFQRLAALFGRS
ncbi:MAG: hypothetical protein ACHQ5A_00625 [Opitutales bacterium]